METLTTPADSHSGDAVLYSIGSRNSTGRGGTSLEMPRERRNPLIADFGSSTAVAWADEIATAKIFSFPLEKPVRNVAPALLRKQVDGVVITYDEASVKCELNIGERVVSVQLPRALFPEKIQYGLPISLEMSEEGGFRKPKISTRQIDENSTSEIAAEFDSILSAFK
jgi:hypothetical protein